MNSNITQRDEIISTFSNSNINFGKEEIINLINNNYTYEEIKRIIEKKVDYYISNKFNNEMIKIYDEKMNDLLELQENLFIKNEMIKQKIFVLENYLYSLKKKN